MDEISSDVDVTLGTSGQLAKLLIGTIAGYCASRLSDKVFNQVVATRRLKEAAAAIQQ